MSLTAKIKASLSVSQQGNNAFGGPHWSAEMDFLQSFADGVTAGKANLAYMAERTVASGANDDIDLAGVLSDALGVVITAAELVALVIINKAKDGTPNTTALTIGGGTNPVSGYLGGTTPTIANIGEGGMILLVDPTAAGLSPIVAGTGDILRVANSAGASNKYQILVLARNA